CYSWTFGDTTTGTGVSPAHTYALPGTYTVGLTVTDISGGTNTISHPITVSAANVLPTAAFTSAATNLNATFNGGGSTDSAGTITGYSWTFGDTTTGTGVSPAHTYALPGTYTVGLTVTDNSGGTNTISHPITVSAANVLPTAAFTSAATNLNATFNGGGSTDSDGTITGYSWTFGDTTTGTGVAPAH